MKNIFPATSLIILLILSSVACESTHDVVSVEQATAAVSIAPLQCGNNDWDKAGKSVEEYYEDLGVRIHDVSSTLFDVDVCTSCACVVGERIDVVVDSEWVGFMESEGFVRFEDWPHDWGQA